MDWFKLDNQTLKSRTFWVALLGVVFNFVAPVAGLAPAIVQAVNTILVGTGVVTTRDAISKTTVTK